jgi:hypothetical protein
VDGAQRSQSCELMDKNRIEPERSGDSLPAKRCGQRRQGASRWHNTPKASGMPLEVNPAAVQWSNVQLPGEPERSGDGRRQISPPQGDEKSAEVVVVEETSRSAHEHVKVAGGLPSCLRPRGQASQSWMRYRAGAFTR